MRKRLNLLVFKLPRFATSIPLLILILSSSTLYAEWYKDYDSGLKASSKGQWQDAITKFQNAIRDRNNEAANLRFYGTRMDDYFPHFYLGLAYYNLKNYQAAANEFQLSQQQGAITERPRLVEQLTNLQTLARAQIVTTKNDSKITEKPYEAPAVAVPVPQQPVKEESQKPSEPSAPTQNPSAEPPKAAPSPESKVEALKFDVDGYKQSMRSGAKKYFEGNYDEAIHSFSAATNADPSQAAGFFYLGCSYASKFLLSGSEDQSLLNKALYAFQQSRKIDPQYGATNTYISPAVLEIYQKTSG